MGKKVLEGLAIWKHQLTWVLVPSLTICGVWTNYLNALNLSF